MRWEIDDLLDHSDPFHAPAEELRARRLKAIREAFAHHHARNPLYRRLCDNRGVRPDALRAPADLLRVPLLSTRAFKEPLALLSVPEPEVVRVHVSSGTSGVQSKVPRDELTLERFSRSLRSAILHVQGRSGYIALLGPSPEELGDLAFANWAAVGCELAQDHEYMLRNYDFDPAAIVRKCNATPHRPVQIGGSPMLILELASHILETGDRITTLTAESRITSGGGFKALGGEAVARDDYNARVREAFGVSTRNIRDAYAMAELNAAVAECEHGCKHVPPWLQLTVRDPANPDREVGLEQEGLAGFLDPCAHSYPGFILADDIVRQVVRDDQLCACGRVGPCLHHQVRRAEGAEARGCGRHIEELRASAG